MLGQQNSVLLVFVFPFDLALYFPPASPRTWPRLRLLLYPPSRLSLCVQRPAADVFHPRIRLRARP